MLGYHGNKSGLLHNNKDPLIFTVKSAVAELSLPLASLANVTDAKLTRRRSRMGRTAEGRGGGGGGGVTGRSLDYIL